MTATDEPALMTYYWKGELYKRIQSFPTRKAATMFLREQEISGKHVALWTEYNGKFSVGKLIQTLNT